MSVQSAQRTRMEDMQTHPHAIRDNLRVHERLARTSSIDLGSDLSRAIDTPVSDTNISKHSVDAKG